VQSPPALKPDRVRAIVFDLDGTLVDSYAPIAESLNRARAAFSLPALAAEEVRRRVGHGLESLIADLVGPDRVDEGVRVFREHYAASYAAGTFALPGVEAALERLEDRGYRMAVASNKPARFGRAILETLGLDGHLEAILGPDSVGHAKPHPAMLRSCLDRLGASADRAVYVGDMVLDVETAARAGLPVVLVAGGSSSVDALRATGETVLDSLEQLPPLLRATSA
jgi:phosphoglycolate phosphatase